MHSSSDTVAPLVVAAARARRGVSGRRAVRRWWYVGAALALLAGGAFALRARAVGWFERLLGRPAAAAAYHVVAPTTLSITLTEDGELKPRESIEIKCEVEGQSTLLYVVPESTRVKKGDLLVELASDTLAEQLRTKQMNLRKIQADYEAAVAELEIQKNQNASNLRKAQIDLDVAELDLRKYLEGDFPGRLREIDLQIEQSQMDIDRKERELQENRELAARGWATSNQVEESEFAVKVARMQLERYQLSRQILIDYEKVKNEKQLTSALDRAREELEREKQRAASREMQAQARVDQYKDQLENAQSDVARIEQQLSKCKMFAPADGIVQYPSYGGFRFDTNRIAAGERVHEGQTLVVLPDTSQMLVATRIHEADRHLVREGLPCVVKVPAVPGEVFTGTITKIDKYAASENRWLNPDLKEHGAEILLDPTDAPLSPGDSAEIRILIDTLTDVIAVPVQCVFTRGTRSFVFIDNGGGPEPVEVELGRSNETLIQVTKGLAVGQRVLMQADDAMLARLPSVEGSDAERHAAQGGPRPFREQHGAGPAAGRGQQQTVQRGARGEGRSVPTETATTAPAATASSDESATKDSSAADASAAEARRQPAEHEASKTDDATKPATSGSAASGGSAAGLSGS